LNLLTYKKTPPVINKTYRNLSIIVWRLPSEGLSCTPEKCFAQVYLIAFTGTLGIEYVPLLWRPELMITIHQIIIVRL